LLVCLGFYCALQLFGRTAENVRRGLAWASPANCLCSFCSFDPSVVWVNAFVAVIQDLGFPVRLSFPAFCEQKSRRWGAGATAPAIDPRPGRRWWAARGSLSIKRHRPFGVMTGRNAVPHTWRWLGRMAAQGRPPFWVVPWSSSRAPAVSAGALRVSSPYWQLPGFGRLGLGTASAWLERCAVEGLRPPPTASSLERMSGASWVRR